MGGKQARGVSFYLTYLETVTYRHAGPGLSLGLFKICELVFSRRCKSVKGGGGFGDLNFQTAGKERPSLEVLSHKLIYFPSLAFFEDMMIKKMIFPSVLLSVF